MTTTLILICLGIGVIPSFFVGAIAFLIGWNEGIGDRKYSWDEHAEKLRFLEKDWYNSDAYKKLVEQYLKQQIDEDELRLAKQWQDSKENRALIVAWKQEINA